MSRVSDRRSSLLVTSSSDTFVDYQTRMVHEAKEIARIANEMSSKAVGEPAALPTLSANLTHHYTQLADDSFGAVLNTNLSDVGMKIRSTVQELGRSCSQLVESSGAYQMQQGDSASSTISMHSRSVNDKVAKVLAALQSCSKGTQACINAASTVSGIIGDIDTTIMFATAGTLHSERDNASFSEHREHILKTAKALVEDTKTLVAGAAGSQDQLAAAAQNAVSTIVQLTGVVKLGAESLGSNNPDSQVMLMNAVKDVASALGELIQATKAASGKPIDDPSMGQLKGSARVMVTNVTSLLKTVKAVEDKHTRGTRALESTIEAISQEINSLQIDGAKGKGTPEELVRATKLVTQATSKAIAAGNSGSQEDIIIAANQGRRAISDLLVVCKNTAYSCTETIELREQTLEAGNKVATHYQRLLQAVLAGAEGKENLPHLSRQVAQSVSELVSLAETLKGRDWVDPEDPTVIAENELLTAASSIEAAARKLASLRPRRSVKETDENLNFDEMILEAAKSITAATSALVKAASDSQRELIDQGKVARRLHKTSDDGQWSEGLVSAARLVVAATQKLVDSAQALVQGHGSEEMLISSAKQVASSTAQLLVASQVKADPDSPSFTRLQAAGNAVIRSTDNLVKSAQQAISGEDEHSLVLNTRMVGGITQEINARSEVFRIEKQLEEARNRLAAIHQAKYRLRKTDEGDQEYYSDQNDTMNQSSHIVHLNNNNQSNKGLNSSYLDKSQTHTNSRTFNTYNNVSPVSFINKNLSTSDSSYDAVKNGSAHNTGSNGQNYKGFTTLYETHRYNTDSSPVIMHSGANSQNLVQTQMNSLSRQITEKKTIKTSAESRTHSHTYKLE
ncbi:talin-1-like [Ctenocephalides felis]|uniref:talin-1-like n=1 Tax=Ctenocephalides felis TaxID=7515 RepID=UPI000E6E4430|nr:talin-1-like [Ctenocephalides felis]